MEHQSYPGKINCVALLNTHTQLYQINWITQSPMSGAADTCLQGGSGGCEAPSTEVSSAASERQCGFVGGKDPYLP